MGGSARVKVRYENHKPSLSLRDRKNLRSILLGAFLPTLHVHVLCMEWNLCGGCWKDCERKKMHVPTPPEAATTISRILTVAQGECQGCLQPINGRPSSPPNPQASLGLTSKGKSSLCSGVEAKRQLTSKFI